MQIKELTDALESAIPCCSAEDFDNVGLLVGDGCAEIESALLAHDVTLAVLDEAKRKGAGLVIAFHPILFSGLKRIANQNYVARIVMKAIREGIALYAMHTNLDNYEKGTSYAMAAHLGLKNQQVLLPKRRTIKKLSTFVPVSEAENLRRALFQAGAGHIGNYSHCSFNFDGLGTYRGEAGANPVVGARFSLHVERETCVTVVFPKHLEPGVLQALFAAHPYEEVAYDVVSLDNSNPYRGMGCIGDLAVAQTERDFLNLLKQKLGLQVLRHSCFTDKKIKRVAWVGGSGRFAIAAAQAQHADAFVSGDLTYHTFFEAEGKILLADVGHYESEFIATEVIRHLIAEKFPKFAAALSETNTNPVHYF